MAHLATNRFNYWNQLAVLIGLIGVGLIIGGAIALILPFIVNLDAGIKMSTNSAQLMENLLKPENAALLRWITLPLSSCFFYPPFYMLSSVTKNLSFT